MRPTELLIVGGGVAGLATAWHAARRGASVRLLEREPALGSMASAQNAAILRTFGPDPALSALARRSAEFLRRPPRQLEPHVPAPLVDEVGLLLLASGDAARTLAARVDPQAGAEELGTGEAARRAPHVAPAAEAAELRLWFAREGRLDVAAQLDAFAAGARAAGVTIETGARVRELLVEGGRVAGARLADGGLRRAATTILAAGAWAGALGTSAGSRVRLRPTRRHLLVTAPDPSVDPRWPVAWVEDAGFYCRPESGGLLLSACDLTDADPDHAGPDPTVKERVAEKASRLLAGFERARAAHFWHGLRTLTADDRFCVGRDPDVEGLAWAAGLGGHGMTSGAEAGRLAAAACLGPEGQEDPAWLAPLDPARLCAGAARARKSAERVPGA